MDIRHQGTKDSCEWRTFKLLPIMPPLHPLNWKCASRTSSWCLCALVFSFCGAQAADKELGRFGPWEAHRVTAGAETYCFIAALPAKSEGKVAKRGEATLMVAHWPKRKAFGQVQVKSGFAIKKDAKLELGVGGKIWKLATEGDSAHGDAKANGEIVAALKGGKTAVAGALPAAGAARIVDTYALDNFAKALAAIDKECEAPRK